jgi:phosphoserine phosphatase RsbX
VDRSSVDGIEYIVVTAPKRGERVSGDAHLVIGGEAGVLVAVIDALGHGADAAAVVELALPVIRGAGRVDLDELFQVLDQSLGGSRGAVAAMARILPTEKRLVWGAVGDVQGVIVGRMGRTTLVSRAGVLGYNSPRVKTAERSFESGDLLCLATDGVAADFQAAVQPLLGLAEIGARLTRLMLTEDDSLALVARLEVRTGAG